jgi:lipopolysaccharide heptosyltransferase I
MPGPQRILIIKPSAIGDVVHALPVLNLLRRRWPDATIDWLVTPACAGLLEGHPQLDEPVLFNRRRFGKGWHNPRAAWDLLKWTLQLRRRRYDLVIDLQGLFRSGWIGWTTGAPRRVGFADARELGWLFYTDRVRLDSLECHAVDRYLKIARSLGCGAEPVEFQFATTDADRQAVAQRLGGVERFAVVLPGTNWQTKRWPIEHFAALVEPLQRQFGLQTVVAGGPGDAELAAKIPGALNLAGQTSLRQLTALLERADLVIANDSGPMHIAAALGRPLVTLFGPTNPTRTGPFNRPDTVLRLDIACSPCYSRKCSHQSCLQWLAPRAVLESARRQLLNHADLPLDNPAVSWDCH